MNYYIQGNKDKAEEIKAAFEKLGCDTTGWKFNADGGLYYTQDARIEIVCNKFLINLINTHPDYKKLPLPKSHYDISNFKPKQWVLVRVDDEWEWSLTRFSYLSNGSAPLFVCINGSSFQQCIPYEGNEHLLGTTDMCPEEYVNW